MNESSYAKLRKAVDEARARNASDAEIITTLVEIAQSTPGGVEALTKAYREAVADNRDSFASAVEDRIFKSRSGSGAGAVIGATVEDGGGRVTNLPPAGSAAVQWQDTGSGKVEKSGGVKSTLNDGLTDAERGRAAAIREGRS